MEETVGGRVETSWWNSQGALLPALRWALLATLLVPSAADAQFGMLKRLKRGPDSASIVNDSLAKLRAPVTASVAPVADTAQAGQSRFQRAKAAAVAASNKFEDVTGVSTKDAALAMSGAGVAGIAAKKLGVDPTSLATKALTKAGEASQKKSMANAKDAPGAHSSGGSPMMSLQGLANGAASARGAHAGSAAGARGSADAAGMQQQMQTMQAMQMMQGGRGAGLAAATNPGKDGYMASSVDAETMLAFQQDMMQVAMAATSGDAKARARLDRWNELSEKMEPEMRTLSVSATAGDMNAMVKMQSMQTAAMREWMGGGDRKGSKGRKP